MRRGVHFQHTAALPGLRTVTAVPQHPEMRLLPYAADATPISTVRRRSGAGCVHPVFVEGKITAWRGLASYKDLETGKRRRRSVTRKTRSAAEKALKALIIALPKAQLVSRRKPGIVALPAAVDEASLLTYLHRWLAHKRRELRPTTYRAYVSELMHLIKSFQTLGNTVQDRNGTKLDLKNCGQYGLLQQCLSFALPRFTWPF